MSANDLINGIVPEPKRKLVLAFWALAVAIVTAAGSIFGAGIYYANLNSELSNYKQQLINDSEAINNLKSDIGKLKTDINSQFAKLGNLTNAELFKNTATQSGSGFEASAPPGRCQPNEVLVGLQPMQGGMDITFQCAAMPHMKVD